MVRCREAGILTNQFAQILIRVQFGLEETVNGNDWFGNTAPAAAVLQVRFKAHVHLQQLINSLPLSVPLLHTHTFITVKAALKFCLCKHTQKVLTLNCSFLVMVLGFLIPVFMF